MATLVATSAVQRFDLRRGRHDRKLHLETLRLYLFELEEAAAEVVFDDLDSGTAESVERSVMHAQHGVLEALIRLQVFDAHRKCPSHKLTRRAIDQQPDDQRRVAHGCTPYFLASGFSWSHARMRVSRG